MVTILIYSMIGLGSALMVYNIWQYAMFARRIRARGDWKQEQRILNFPIFLLILFLCGYLAVGFFGHPDLLVSGILFGGSIFVAVIQRLIRRIADRIKENEQLEARLLAAEDANTAKTFFLSNMSHDIRTPLNAILGYTTLAKRDGLSLEEEKEYLKKIESAGQKLLAIVDDVLEMSRIERGKLELEPTAIDIDAHVRKAAELMDGQMAAKGIQYSVETKIQSNWVMCDGDRLDRVLVNILSNAYKFTPEGGQVSLKLQQTDAGETAGIYEIRIKDSGIGMSPEFAKSIFLPFERERTSTVSKTQGTGLGMAITKTIVDMMGGRIEVVTERGKGSEFIVELKLPYAEKPITDHQCFYEERDCSQIRLLLVEDNPVNREIAVAILEEKGFQIETAENGQEAVEKLALSEPGYYDLILMDIQMPVMDGYEATKLIRALPDHDLSKTPIVAMTANAFKEDERAAIAAGMQGHIAKPLNIEQMMQTLSEVLTAEKE